MIAFLQPAPASADRVSSHVELTPLSSGKAGAPALGSKSTQASMSRSEPIAGGQKEQAHQIDARKARRLG